MDTEGGGRFVLGAEYDFCNETKTKAVVQYVETYKNISEMQESIVSVQLTHLGYAFKIPIYGCNNDNPRGHFATLSLFSLANLITYWLLKKRKDKKPFDKTLKY